MHSVQTKTHAGDAPLYESLNRYDFQPYVNYDGVFTIPCVNYCQHMIKLSNTHEWCGAYVMRDSRVQSVLTSEYGNKEIRTFH